MNKWHTNFHNRDIWSEVNPYSTHRSIHQQQLPINVWAGIVEDTSHTFCLHTRWPSLPIFLEHTVPLDIQQNKQFIHDGVQAHFSYIARNYPKTSYNWQWTRKQEPLSWPIHSSDLNLLDFFLLKHILFFKREGSSDGRLVIHIIHSKPPISLIGVSSIHQFCYQF